MNFQSSQAKQKQKKIPPKFDKILGCYNYPEFYSSFNSIKTKCQWKMVAKGYNDLYKYTKI
jgi:hypothetical protein